MVLAVRPPITPMLARLTRELPLGDLTYEPKWDGFRCLAFVDAEADDIDLRSRHDRPLGRYFPEIVGGLRSVLGDGPGAVLDGEIILRSRDAGLVADGGETLGFDALMSRLHPAASRVERLRDETPTRYVAFDVLALGSTDLRSRPFVERRATLERLLGGEDRTADVSATPATRSPTVAALWLRGQLGPGIDGVVAKPDDLRYEPGRRTMIKVKQLRTADCVVAGMRLVDASLAGSLLLGLYDDEGVLHHVGVVSQMPVALRRSMVDQLAPLMISLEEHPWRRGFVIGRSPLGRLPGSAARWTPEMEHDWVPLRPETVIEVGFDQVDGERFRHPARFLRWRPDRTAPSCRLDQIVAGPPAVGAAS
jgi:ATP-dependent DNA ligase